MNYKIIFIFVVVFISLSCTKGNENIYKDDLNWINVQDDISVYFSPNNNLEIVLIQLLQSAKESIDVAIYDITNKNISDALINEHKNGINVRVYCDKGIQNRCEGKFETCKEKCSDGDTACLDNCSDIDNSCVDEKRVIDDMRYAGINVYIANTKNWIDVESYRAIMHNKFIIVDQETILTGSYNFSKNADENNRENFIIIKNSLVASEYQRAFDGYWENP